MSRTHFARPLAAVTTTLLLSPCSTLPLPLSVNVVKARVSNLSLTAPLPGPLDRAGAGRVPRSLRRGARCDRTLSEAEANRRCHLCLPDLTGEIQVRAYPVGSGDEVPDRSNTLGSTLTLRRDCTNTRVAGAAVQKPDQLGAVSDREVC